VPTVFCTHAPHQQSKAFKQWYTHRREMDRLYSERLRGLGLYDLGWGLGRAQGRLREGELKTPLCAATPEDKNKLGYRTAKLGPTARACLEGRCPPSHAHPFAATWREVEKRTRAAPNLPRCLHGILRRDRPPEVVRDSCSPHV